MLNHFFFGQGKQGMAPFGVVLCGAWLTVVASEVTADAPPTPATPAMTSAAVSEAEAIAEVAVTAGEPASAGTAAGEQHAGGVMAGEGGEGTSAKKSETEGEGRGRTGWRAALGGGKRGK